MFRTFESGLGDQRVGGGSDTIRPGDRQVVHAVFARRGGMRGLGHELPRPTCLNSIPWGCRGLRIHRVATATLDPGFHIGYFVPVMTTVTSRPRYRLRRALLLLGLFFAVTALAVGGGSWWLSGREPEWYQPKQADPQELAAASDRAEKQIERTLSWAQDQQASASRHGAGDNAPTRPASSTEISFSETELNGFFQKWDKAFGWSQLYAAYVADPMVVVREQKILIAARVKELGAVVTVELWPRLENGQLQVGVTRVLAGQLPLPRAMWSRYITVLSNTVGGNLNGWRAKADITPRAGANNAAASASMSELLIDALHDRPSNPVLFLPIAGSSGSLPVQITDVSIGNQTLQLTVRPLTADEQKLLLAHIRDESPIVSVN